MRIPMRKALHIRDPEDLALAYLLPTIFIALFFRQQRSPVAASFGGGLAACYFIYPPQVSIWIEDSNHVAELGFILIAVDNGKQDGRCHN